MSRLLPRALPLCAVTLLLATTIAAPAASASPGSGTHPARTPPATTPSPEAVQEFVDTRVPELLDEHGAPGIAVTVVADGTQVASAAHGMADLARSTPLDEATHSFPTASIAKSFTAMAVLQLVERGDIDLDEDDGTLRWDVSIHPEAGGGEQEIEVDAASGDIVSSRHDGDDDGDDDDD